jgi:Myb-like DNA-binding domain
MVAERVGRRTDMSCRERYINVLDPSLRKGPWTLEEDWRLQEAVEAFQSVFSRISWAAVARRVPGRTDSMCGLRYQRVVSKSALPPPISCMLCGNVYISVCCTCNKNRKGFVSAL